MYYITTKDSKTGMKFQKLYKNKNEIEQKHLEFTKEYGGYIHSDVMLKIECCYFPDDDEMSNLWKPFGDYGCMPDTSTKEGKEIAKLLEAIPFISREELDSCVSDTEVVNITRFNQETTLFGFVLPENSKFTPPVDCFDINEYTYLSLFNSEELPF